MVCNLLYSHLHDSSLPEKSLTNLLSEEYYCVSVWQHCPKLFALSRTFLAVQTEECAYNSCACNHVALLGKETTKTLLEQRYSS